MEYKNGALCLDKINIDDNKKYAIEDPENRSELLLDSSNKIISYRKNDGSKVEKVGIETSRLILTQEGMSEFQQALKKSGFNPGGVGDWSDYISNDGENPLQLPEPRCAIVNFTGISSFPTTKGVDLQGYIEYSDLCGNYFKKQAILNGQGSSSLAHNNQKNIAVDLFDSEWGGDAFSVKIGKWVPQDSFHIKSFYMDPVRGLADVCYKYAEFVIEKTDARPNRLAKESELVTINGDTGVYENDFDTGALCHPDGFPCYVYLNGGFVGIYAWNLKKHRDNYMMNKKDYESIHIDPEWCNLWNLRPINWSGMEIRNPKTLICMDGTKYDGDDPKELIDLTSEFYDPSNKDHKNTVKTKNIIVALHDAVKSINDAPTVEEKKALFEQTFDVHGYIVFWIICQLYDNWDGLRDRNTQWLYYKKSGKWCPSLYDLDNCIGYCGGPWLNDPYLDLSQLSEYRENITQGFLWNLYRAEIVQIYQSLRQQNIITSDAFVEKYNEWYNRLDLSYIKRNVEIWDVPCYRDGKINKEYWKQIGLRYGVQSEYDENTLYHVGDVIYFGYGYYIGGPYCIQVECIKECQGEAPCGFYPNKPQLGGTFDSPRRIKAWLDRKIEILDNSIVLTD